MQVDESLLEAVRRLSSKELERLILTRQADDKVLRALWRAAVAREREEQRQGEVAHATS